MPPTLTGRVGSRKGLKDGAKRPLRLGREGQLITTGMHGRYYEAASRGQVFVGRQTINNMSQYGTSANSGLYNPSDSPVFLTPVRYEFAIRDGFGVSVSAFRFASGTPVAIASVTKVALSSSVIAVPVGTNHKPFGHMISFGAEVTSDRPFMTARLPGSLSTGATSTLPYLPTFACDFDGHFVLGPGTFLTCQRDQAVLLDGEEIWVWEEEVAAEVADLVS